MARQFPQRKSSLNAVAGVLFVVGVFAAQPVMADGSFTSASLQGNYAYVNNTSGVGSLGPLTFDGQGGLTLTLKVNVPCDDPSFNCSREITDLSATGTYTVEPDGTGVATIDFIEIGTTVYDFVISESTRERGRPVATEVFAVSRTGGLAGQLIAPVWSRVSTPFGRF